MTQPHARRATLSSRQEFAAELSRLRERSGLSVRDLAAAVNAPLATIGGYLSGRHLPTAGQSDLLRQLLTAVGITDPIEVDRWLEAAISLRRSPATRLGPEVVPYRGLFSYQKEDSAWFFGREELTARLLQRARTGGLCIVVGASGAGKSSLLRAGLLAAWPVDDGVLITPGTDPNGELDRVLAAAEIRSLLIVDQFEELFTLVDSAAERHRFLERIVEIAARADSPGVVLGLRADFYAAASRLPMLLPALQMHQTVLGAMTEAELTRAILGPTERAGLTVEPGLVRTLLSELTPRGLSGSGPEVGALPLLSHAMREVCLRARRGRLTVADYQATGGIVGAIAQSAERVWSSLSPGDRHIARRLLLRMVNLDEDSVVTRRSTSVDDPAMMAVLAPLIDERLVTADENTVGISHEALLTAWPRLHDWIAQDRSGLINLRNLRNQAAIWADGGDDPSALLRGGRLSAVTDWLATSERGSELDVRERSFVEASQAAEISDRYRSRRRLRTLRMLVAVTVVLLLIASGLAVYASNARSQAQRGQSDAQATSARALSRQLAVNAQQLRATDPNVAAQLALVAFRTSPTVQARSALLDATANDVPTRIGGHDGPTFALVGPDQRLMAVSDDSDGTVHLYSTADPRRPHALGIARPAKKVEQFSAAYTPDGRYLIVGSSDGTITSWNVTDPEHPGVPHTVPAFAATGVNGLAVSPDGATAIGAGTDPGLAVFRITGGILTGKRIVRMPDGKTTARTVAYSPDGRHVVAAGGGVLAMWTASIGNPDPMADPEPVSFGSVGASSINAVAFSPDSRTLAVGPHSGLLALYRVTGAAVPAPMTVSVAPFTSWINALTFSADGSALAAGSSDTSAVVFATGSWKTILKVQHPSLVTAVQFLRGTDELATASTDGGVRIWPVPGPRLDNLAGSVFAVRWFPDSSHLVAGTGRVDRGIGVWNVSDPIHPRLEQTAGVAPDKAGLLTGIAALTPDARTLALGQANGPVQLWNLAAAPPIQIGSALSEPTDLLENMTFSPSARLLAAGGDQNLIFLWDTTNPQKPRLVTAPIRQPNQIYWLAFSPDEKFLAAAVIDRTVRVFDISNPAAPRVVTTLTGFTNYAFAVAFSTDGKLLAAGSADRTVRLWNISDPAHPVALGGPLTGPTNQINDVEFSPDGTRLIAASLDQSVWIWNTSNPSAPTIWAQLTSTDGPVWVANYSPNGTAIAAGSTNDRLSVWKATPELAATQICQEVGSPITPTQWEIYLPDQPYQPPCPVRP